MGDEEDLFDFLPVYPLNCTDLVKPFVCTFGFWLSAKCNTNKLCKALHGLIAEKWRIVGARLWKNVRSSSVKTVFSNSIMIEGRSTSVCYPTKFQRIARVFRCQNH